MSARAEGEDNLDRVLASLDRQQKWTVSPTRSYLQLEYLTTVDDYDYRETAHFQKVHPGDPLRDIFTVNEHLAVMLSVVMNALILLVFIRVLGLARLPSRLLVSLAAVNLVSSLSLALHTSSVSTAVLSHGRKMCRFIAFFETECFILFNHALCGAIVERMIACNMPSYYSRALHIIGPAVILSPWGYWVLNIILMYSGVYEFDLGYECSSHTNLLLPDSSMAAGKRSVSILLGLLMGGLILSMILHNQNSGDVWEINRTQFELRTTRVVLNLAGVTVLFILPDALATLYRINGLTYQETRMMHIACQLSIHKGLSLILVMLTRQEFRRHLVLVFESAESIRRTRTTNLLITHTPMRTHSSRLLRFSDNRTSTELSSAIDELPAVEPRPVQPVVSVTPTLQPAAALTYEKSGLVGRDKISAVQTPEWLKKKDSPRQWSWSRLFASSTDDHTDTMSYEVDSDV